MDGGESIGSSNLVIVDRLRTEIPAALTALLAIGSPTDLVQFRHKVEVARDIARRAKLALQAQNDFAQAKLEIEHRLGAMIPNLIAGRGRPKKVTGHDIFLADIGITRNQSSRFQAVARITIDVMRRYFALARQMDEEITWIGLSNYDGARGQLSNSNYRSGTRLKFARHSFDVNPETYSVEYYTPSYVFDAMGARFDLDVASPGKKVVPWIPARKHYTSAGLERDWSGFVWCNAPYGEQLPDWLDKFVQHGNGVALVADRTSAGWWQSLVSRVELVLFTARKIEFVRPPGEPPSKPTVGSALVSIGPMGAAALRAAHANGLGVLLGIE
jgi:hypothetical protein